MHLNISCELACKIVLLLFTVDDTDNAKAGLYGEWQALSKKIEALREQLNKPQGSFVFNFVQVSPLCFVPRSYGFGDRKLF